MERYLAGTEVTVVVPLQTRSGAALDVASISYRVVDQTGVEKVASTPLTGFTASDTTAQIVVPAGANALTALPADSAITADMIDALNTREVRTVELTCILVSGNTVTLNALYGLEPADPLHVGLNSFQTISQAELTALDIPNIPGWTAATENDRIAAMVAARNNICKLNFALPESNLAAEQAVGLATLTPVEFLALPERLKAALRLAQVAEADAILGGDPVDVRRREGLLLESIGEVKQMFRAGKPIDLPVSKRALRYLSGFVSFSRRVGRG